MYLVKGFPPGVDALQETTSCPRCPGVEFWSPAELCPGPVVLDAAFTVAGADGTVVNKTEEDGDEGSDCPFALVAFTVATPVTFWGIPITVIGEDVPTSENVPDAPQLIVTV